MIPPTNSMGSDNLHGHRPTILVVDDLQDNLRLLVKILSQRGGYAVRPASSGSFALVAAHKSPPDLILLDIKMPQMDGYEVCQRLKADETTQDIPIIFISALDEPWDKVKAFQVGGVDYITKPFEAEEVLARVKNQLSLQGAKAEVHQLNAELEQRVLERTDQLRQAQEQLLHLALHDPLTGLPNRTLFVQRLEKAIEQAKQDPDYRFAVLFLDCDRFKAINDSLGHLVGDQLLVVLAKQLQSAIPLKHTLARLGGDEFTILLQEIGDRQDAIKFSQQIQQLLNQPFSINAYEVFINVSIGICLGKGYEKPEHLLRDADTAMYEAKAIGKGCYQVFDTGMHQKAIALWQLETDLRRAVDRQEFFLYYQPIVCLKTGTIGGFEALVRWMHPDRGFVTPNNFISVAEETGLILPLGLWVLREACRQLQEWREGHKLKHPLTMGVNLSVKQFVQPDLLEKIDGILAETQLESHCLKLEITESAIVNGKAAADLLAQLKLRQIQLSLDDFGTGYSSLSYLHRFPFDTLKIDRSFISPIDEVGNNLEIVEAIVTLAQKLKMNTIAEGVETRQQLAHLRNLGCEFAQGSFFAPALSKDAAEAMLLAFPHW